MGVFKKEDVWIKRDDVRHFNRSNPGYRTRRNRRFAAATTVILVLGGAIVVGWFQENTVLTNWNNVKYNSLLYADTSQIKNSKYFGVLLFRRIRPLNNAELSEAINKSNIPEWEKLKRRTMIDTSSENNQPVMIYSDLTLRQDSMFKYKTAFIGSVIGKDSLTAEMPKDNLSTSPKKWLAIKPNKNLVEINQTFKLPKNYVYADKNYYVDPLDVTIGGEPTIFRNTKPSP
jgi:hypothetical protein